MKKNTLLFSAVIYFIGMVGMNIIFNLDSLNPVKVLVLSLGSTIIYIGFLALLKKSNS